MNASPSNPLCIAHRGASGYEPENTLSSFRKAIVLGAQWIELDIQACGDHFVVFHDRTLDRRAGRPGILNTLSLEEAIGIEVGSGEKVPLLSAVMQELRGKVSVNIEVKGAVAVPRLVSYLATLQHEGWNDTTLVLSSFDHHLLHEVKKSLPTISVAPIFHGTSLFAAETAKNLGTSRIVTDIDFLTPTRYASLEALGLRVWVYTVNYISDIREMIHLGVDGIISNYPDRVLTAINEKQCGSR